MSRFVLRRLAISLVLAWLVLTATFAVLHLAPGDPAERFVDPRVPRAQAEHIRSLYGLDRPFLVQYLAWLRSLALEGELGTSFQFQQPVLGVLLAHLPATMLLGTCALLLQWVVGVSLGILAATRPDSLTDHLVRLGSATIYALPTFWLGLMLILLMSGVLDLLPPSGMASPFADEWSHWQRLVDLTLHLILPAIVLGLPLAGPVARLLRNGLLEELGKDYVLAARARGLKPLRVIAHAVRNASAPLVQWLGLSLPLLFAGSIIVEHVFSWPGLGSITVNAINARDYPLVLGTTVLSALSVIAGSFLADIGHAALDPRVRFR